MLPVHQVGGHRLTISPLPVLPGTPGSDLLHALGWQGQRQPGGGTRPLAVAQPGNEVARPVRHQGRAAFTDAPAAASFLGQSEQAQAVAAVTPRSPLAARLRPGRVVRAVQPPGPGLGSCSAGLRPTPQLLADVSEWVRSLS